jgi:hypothetical protein
MNDRQMALQFCPFFYSDKNEPFRIKYIGYSIIRGNGKSPSFNRMIDIPEGVDCIVEYAIYFDYDIQHMYDLEHVWVYISPEGTVVDAESSTHGQFVNCYRLRGDWIDGTRIPLYFQPGKHAIMPRPELFQLYNNYMTCCMEDAGKDGLLVPDMLRHAMKTDDSIDAAIHKYVQKNFRFQPTLQYVPSPMEDVVFYPIEELLEQIPKSIENALRSAMAVPDDGE